MSKPVRIIVMLAAALVVLFMLIQLIPLDTTNPPVVTQVQWDSPQTKALWDRACADCHSNETVWPWYSKVAPASWLVLYDVRRGRDEFNLSNLNTSSNRFSRLPERIARSLQEGEMPPLQYTIIHSNAKLSDAEAQALIDGMRATLANPISYK